MQQTDMIEPGPRFACLMADSPWAERGGGKIKRGADRHYDLLAKPGDPTPIYRVIMDSGLWVPAENAHAWLWYTDNFLTDALLLMKVLGFRYVRTFVWVKTKSPDLRVLPDIDVCDRHGVEWERCGCAELAVSDKAADADLRIGIGQYGRGCHEGVLFGVRGKGQHESVWTGNRSVRSVFHAPHVLENGKRKHSAKPPRSYELIESVSKGPRVEFFARSQRPGWTSWGNEVAT